MSAGRLFLNSATAVGCAAKAIAIIGVGTVAGFDSRLDHSVAAGSGYAIVETVIVIVGIAVVTVLGADLYESVSAGGWDASVQASIGVVRIAVVASLSAIRHAVSANRIDAIEAASVGVEVAVGAAIVALLDAGLDHAVSASG